MTTLAPVIDLVGDIGHFSCFVYGGARWVLYLRESGELELHRSLDGLTAWWGLDVAYVKKQVTACVFDDELIIVWTLPVTNELYLSKWHLGTHKYTQQPTLLWAGDSPSLARYLDTKLILNYRNGAQQHAYRTSLDTGVVWSAPVIVDSNVVTEIDTDVYPASSVRVYWDETST